jgi:hypothetical protein
MVYGVENYFGDRGIAIPQTDHRDALIGGLEKIGHEVVLVDRFYDFFDNLKSVDLVYLNVDRPPWGLNAYSVASEMYQRSVHLGHEFCGKPMFVYSPFEIHEGFFYQENVRFVVGHYSLDYVLEIISQLFSESL